MTPPAVRILFVLTAAFGFAAQALTLPEALQSVPERSSVVNAVAELGDARTNLDRVTRDPLAVRADTMQAEQRLALAEASLEQTRYAAQQELTTRIGQLGTITIKSLDRNDRDVAAEGAWALKLLLDHYGRHKSRMPREWFIVDRSNFVGFSEQALDMLVDAKTWYEMKVLQQLELAFLRALHGPTDTVAVFSDALRVIASRSHERHDEQALRLEIRFFNNFLREAIRSGELRAVYDVLHQYRQLARTIIERDDNIPPLADLVAELSVARSIAEEMLPELKAKVSS